MLSDTIVLLRFLKSLMGMRIAIPIFYSSIIQFVLDIDQLELGYGTFLDSIAIFNYSAY